MFSEHGGLGMVEGAQAFNFLLPGWGPSSLGGNGRSPESDSDLLILS